MMKKVQHIETINEYNVIAQQQTLHPLVSVIDFSKLKPSSKSNIEKNDIQALSFGFYAIFLKEDKHCDIRYGKNNYDYQEGTLLFIAPQQVTSIEEDGEDYKPSGYALLFHPDLIRGTSLAHNINDYTFFAYRVYEALHLSKQEKKIILDCFKKITHEIKHSIDKHSKKLIVANIELFLNYCIRFYDRQFITRNDTNTSIIEKFEYLLNNYFASDLPQTQGTPLVAYFANELNLSANYFGDIIKKDTGKTAQEYIQLKLIEVAKEKMYDSNKSLSQVANELGFKYQQHFTRFFKQHVGYTPNTFRSSIN